MKNILKSAALLGVLSSAAVAQVSYTTPGATYSETFTKSDGWGTTNINIGTWTDNSTVSGWYASYSNNGTANSTPASIIQSNGTQNTNNSLYMFRSATDSTTLQDGALGAFPVSGNVGSTVGAGGVFYGTQITNNTGEDLVSFSLGYTMEVWRTATNSNTLTVSFSTDATSLTTGTWTVIDALTLTAAASASAASVNGNDSANRTISSTSVVNFESALASGDSLWIRWFDVNSSGVDAGIGIDDVSFSASAVPEPSAFAALAGLGALGFVATRRRRSAR